MAWVKIRWQSAQARSANRHPVQYLHALRFAADADCHARVGSIQAALASGSSDALYFVARGDGSSHFSRTLDEHNRAVNKYQRGGEVKGKFITLKASTVPAK
jgi:hypothetical protein